MMQGCWTRWTIPSLIRQLGSSGVLINQMEPTGPEAVYLTVPDAKDTQQGKATVFVLCLFGFSGAGSPRMDLMSAPAAFFF